MLFWFRLSIYMCLSLHVTWHLPHHLLGSSDSPKSAYSDLGAWSLWTLPVADQRCAAELWIIDRLSKVLSFQVPCYALEFFFCNSWAFSVLFIIIYLFIFSHLRLSVTFYPRLEQVNRIPLFTSPCCHTGGTWYAKRKEKDEVSLAFGIAGLSQGGPHEGLLAQW